MIGLAVLLGACSNYNAFQKPSGDPTMVFIGNQIQSLKLDAPIPATGNTYLVEVSTFKTKKYFGRLIDISKNSVTLAVGAKINSPGDLSSDETPNLMEYYEEKSVTIIKDDILIMKIWK